MAQRSGTSTPQLGQEAGEDLALQVRSWRVHRFGWLAGVTFLIGALLSLFGHDPLAQATRTSVAGAFRWPTGAFRWPTNGWPGRARRAPVDVRIPGRSDEAEAVVLWLDGE